MNYITRIDLLRQPLLLGYGSDRDVSLILIRDGNRAPFSRNNAAPWWIWWLILIRDVEQAVSSRQANILVKMMIN